MAAATTSSAAAAGGVTFTVTVASAYLHAEPVADAERTYSVFQGHTYAVTARTTDGTWVSLDYATATAGTWIRAAMGTVAGSLDSVPVDGATAAILPSVGTSTASSVPPASTSLPATSGASSVLGI